MTARPVAENTPPCTDLTARLTTLAATRLPTRKPASSTKFGIIAPSLETVRRTSPSRTRCRSRRIPKRSPIFSNRSRASSNKVKRVKMRGCYSQAASVAFVSPPRGADKNFFQLPWACFFTIAARAILLLPPQPPPSDPLLIAASVVSFAWSGEMTICALTRIIQDRPGNKWCGGS